MPTLFCVFLAATADEPRLLKCLFKPGDSAKYVQTVRMTTTGKKTGKGKAADETVIEIKIATTWKVHAVGADGSADLGQTITRIRLTQKRGGEEDVADSGNDDASPAVREFLDDLIKNELRMKMRSTGEITDVVLPTRISERLKKGLPDKPELTEQVLTQMIKKSGFILPDFALDVGRSWPGATILSAGMPLETTYLMKYEGFAEHEGRKVLKLALATDQDSKGKTKSGPPKTTEGEALLDPVTCWPIEVVERHSLTLGPRTGSQLVFESELRRKDPK